MASRSSERSTTTRSSTAKPRATTSTGSWRRWWPWLTRTRPTTASPLDSSSGSSQSLPRWWVLTISEYATTYDGGISFEWPLFLLTAWYCPCRTAKVDITCFWMRWYRIIWNILALNFSSYPKRAGLDSGPLTLLVTSLIPRPWLYGVWANLIWPLLLCPIYSILIEARYSAINHQSRKTGHVVFLI